MVEKGQRPEENQVSSTSASCLIPELPQALQAVGSSLVTVILPQSSQYQAGMRCPHQICREMHQSWIFSIQSKYVFSHCAGTIRVSPSRTARIAGAASGF